MNDLSTRYLGLTLKNPLVVSASPLSKRLDRVRKLEEAGASAIVLYSLFEEQIINESRALDHYLSHGTESYAEALSYYPDLPHYNLEPDVYLEHLQRVKAAVAIPVIGSLNGVSRGHWTEYAAKIAQAGADALELNLYYVPTDPDLDAFEIEQMYLDLVREVRAHVHIPLALKLSPFFSALPAMARQLVAAGADGLVLFNRFYQPDIDLEQLTVVPTAHLSRAEDLLLPLRWIAILSGRVATDYALTGGVHSAHDVLKAMMAGAKVTMLASELLAHGIGRLAAIEHDLREWMEQHEYESIAQMQGSMNQHAVAEPAAFERAHYLRALNTFDNRLLGGDDVRRRRYSRLRQRGRYYHFVVMWQQGCHITTKRPVGKNTLWSIAPSRSSWWCSPWWCSARRGSSGWRQATCRLASTTAIAPPQASSASPCISRCPSSTSHCGGGWYGSC
ncbi:dihydroorotate dehydrogenase-like protein [Candidatus Gracilibacteria bacterium]|nr:dihydroorotate dehydrogenase-like protein [Candidatus Gracilibacteria bacterium]